MAKKRDSSALCASTYTGSHIHHIITQKVLDAKILMVVLHPPPPPGKVSLQRHPLPTCTGITGNEGNGIAYGIKGFHAVMGNSYIFLAETHTRKYSIMYFLSTLKSLFLRMCEQIFIKLDTLYDSNLSFP